MGLHFLNVQVHGRFKCVHGMVWHGMAEVCEGAPVAVSGWVLTDRHDVGPRLALTDASQTYSKLLASVWHVSYDGVADNGCLHTTYTNTHMFIH